MSSNASETPLPDPDVDKGIEYWATQPASYDGVLGGYGTGSLPRVDALGSRQFLLYLLPELSTVPSAVRPLHIPEEISKRRPRVLDVAAGVGRVTADVLLHLFSDVVLVEPVEPFINEALRRGKASEAPGSGSVPVVQTDPHELEVVPWKGIHDKSKSVTFIQATLQDFDPTHPTVANPKTKVLDRIGYVPPSDDLDDKFDVVWCQWCLGAMSDTDLIDFFRKSRAALREPTKGLIVVKENACSEDGGPRAVFDESDSSLTRSDLAWKQCFAEAGLKLIHEETQRGFPEGLYPVKMYALR